MDIRKTLRTFAVLAAAFLVLLVGYRLMGPAAPDDAGVSRRTLGTEYGLTADEVTRIEMSYADPDLPSLTLEKRDGAWQLLQPVTAPADTSKVRELLRVLDRDIRKRVSGDLSAFGFDNPQATMTVSTDAATKTFLFGNKGVSYALYVKEANDQDAAIMESWILDEVMRTPSEMRDRRLLRFDPADVTRIEVARGSRSTSVSAERASPTDPWRLTAPTPTKADQKAIERAVNALSDLSIDEFVADGVADLSPWSLDTPAVTIRLTLVDGKRYGLRVADENGRDAPAIVALDGMESVFSLPAGFLESLPESAFDWRDRRIADFQRVDTRRIEIVQRDAPAVTLEKMEEDGKGVWYVTRPQRLRADDARLSDLLLQLDAAEATRILSEDGSDAVRYGLDAPFLTLSIYDRPGEGPGTILRFGKRIGNGVVVQSSRSPVIALVPSASIEGWTEGTAGFRSRTLLEFEPLDVRRVELRRPDGVLAFARQGIAWRIAKPVLEPADNNVVEGLLMSLNGLQVARFLTPTPPASETGLDRPTLTVALFFKNAEWRTIRFGRARGDAVYGVLDGDSTPFLMPKVTLRAFDLSLDDVRVKEEPRP